MASKATKKKKSGASKKTAKQAGRRTAREANKKSSTQAAKKKGTKKAGKKPTTITTAKRTSPGADSEVESKDVILALDDLIDVDDMVSDSPAPASTKKAKSDAKNRSPQTPTVPRSVKPPPKSADLVMSAEILEFVAAIDKYRQENCRPFPTWTEVFHILAQLGYRKS